MFTSRGLPLNSHKTHDVHNMNGMYWNDVNDMYVLERGKQSFEVPIRVYIMLSPFKTGDVFKVSELIDLHSSKQNWKTLGGLMCCFIFMHTYIHHLCMHTCTCGL